MFTICQLAFGSGACAPQPCSCCRRCLTDTNLHPVCDAKADILTYPSARAEAVWGYLRTSLSCSGRLDLMPLVDGEDLEGLQRQLPLQ